MLYACFILQMLSMIGFRASLPFTPLFLLKDLYMADAAEAGLWSGIMAAVSALTLAALAPIWGAVADRYGRKSMILRALLGGSVTVGLMAFCHNVWVLLLLEKEFIYFLPGLAAIQDIRRTNLDEPRCRGRPNHHVYI